MVLQQAKHGFWLQLLLLVCALAVVSSQSPGLGSTVIRPPAPGSNNSCVFFEPVPAKFPPIVLVSYRKSGALDLGLCQEKCLDHTAFYAAPIYVKGAVNGTKCACSNAISTTIQVSAAAGACNVNCLDDNPCGGFDLSRNIVAWSLYGTPESSGQKTDTTATITATIDPSTATATMSQSTISPFVTVIPVTDSNGEIVTVADANGKLVVLTRTILVTAAPGLPRPSSTAKPSLPGPSNQLDPALLGSLIGVGAIGLVAFFAIVQVNRKRGRDQEPKEVKLSPPKTAPSDEGTPSKHQISQTSRLSSKINSVAGGAVWEFNPANFSPPPMEKLPPEPIENRDSEESDVVSAREAFRYPTPDDADTAAAPAPVKISLDLPWKLFDPVTSTERSIQFSPRSGGGRISVGTGRNESTTSHIASSVVLGAMPSSLKNDLLSDEHGSIFVGFQNFEQSWFDDPNILRATPAVGGAGPSSQTPLTRRKVTAVSRAESIRNTRRPVSRTTVGDMELSTNMSMKGRHTRSPSDGTDSIVSYMSGSDDAASDVFVSTDIEAQPNKKRRNASSVYMNLLANNE